MRKLYKEIKKNIYRVYYEPESGDYAVIISVLLVIGILINLAFKGGF